MEGEEEAVESSSELEREARADCEQRVSRDKCEVGEAPCEFVGGKCSFKPELVELVRRTRDYTKALTATGERRVSGCPKGRNLHFWRSLPYCSEGKGAFLSSVVRIASRLPWGVLFPFRIVPIPNLLAYQYVPARALADVAKHGFRHTSLMYARALRDGGGQKGQDALSFILSKLVCYYMRKGREAKKQAFTKARNELGVRLNVDEDTTDERAGNKAERQAHMGRFGGLLMDGPLHALYYWRQEYVPYDGRKTDKILVGLKQSLSVMQDGVSNILQANLSAAEIRVDVETVLVAALEPVLEGLTQVLLRDAAKAENIAQALLSLCVSVGTAVLLAVTTATTIASIACEYIMGAFVSVVMTTLNKAATISAGEKYHVFRLMLASAYTAGASSMRSAFVAPLQKAASWYIGEAEESSLASQPIKRSADALVSRPLNPTRNNQRSSSYPGSMVPAPTGGYVRNTDATGTHSSVLL
jgi:hypothetical protein